MSSYQANLIITKYSVFNKKRECFIKEQDTLRNTMEVSKT